MLKQEYQYLLAAIQFFTRIPLPSSVAHDSVTLNQALKYFPLIGWLVGGVCGLTYYLAIDTWPVSVAVVLSIIAIMKDPRIGNYAALGLILILLLKTVLLIQLAQESAELLLIALLLAHSASRLLVLPLPWLLDYAREDDDSKSRTMGEGRFNGGMLAYSSLFVVLPLLFLDVPPLWYAFANAGVVALLMTHHMVSRISINTASLSSKRE